MKYFKVIKRKIRNFFRYNEQLVKRSIPVFFDSLTAYKKTYKKAYKMIDCNLFIQYNGCMEMR